MGRREGERVTITRRRFIAAGAAVGAFAAAGGSLSALAEPEATPQLFAPEAFKRMAGVSGFGLGDTVRIFGSTATDGIYRVVGCDPLQLWDGRSMLTIGGGG